MKIQVIGSGCATCKKLYEMTQKAVAELSLKDKVDYVTGSLGISKIIELGVMSSPVLIVDDKVVMVGLIPNIEKIKGLLSGEVKPAGVGKSECSCGGKC